MEFLLEYFAFSRFFQDFSKFCKIFLQHFIDFWGTFWGFLQIFRILLELSFGIFWIVVDFRLEFSLEMISADSTIFLKCFTSAEEPTERKRNNYKPRYSKKKERNKNKVKNNEFTGISFASWEGGEESRMQMTIVVAAITSVETMWRRTHCPVRVVLGQR